MDNVENFINELPKAQFMESIEIRKWQGYWFQSTLLPDAITFNAKFKARNDDVFLASSMKTGTTWLKALVFCIMHRQNDHTLDDALSMEIPHSLIPTIEAVCMSYTEETAIAKAYDASAPRVLHTHLPHMLLPDSVKNSACKIVYVARNPKDTVISSWHFFNSFVRRDQEPFPLEKYIDCFCSGMLPFGPFVEHVAEFWMESRKMPDKILFLKYEDLKADPKRHVIKIAEFLERPLGDDDGGEVDAIVQRCSLERLKNLEVNKSGSHFLTAPNNSFFRKGQVGDFKNYLTPQMETKIHQTILLKLEGIGLHF